MIEMTIIGVLFVIAMLYPNLYDCINSDDRITTK
jgi:hypothetical protein